MRVTKTEHAEALESLRKWIKAGDTVFTILEHVSRSGMQRSISVLVPYVNDSGKVGFVHPNHLVSVVTGSRRSQLEGVIVNGCGMDMGFHLVYSLSRAMFPDGFGCIGKGCPSNDHSNGDRDYTPHTCDEGAFPPQHGRDYANPHKATTDGGACHWHRDGGYAIVQKWI